MNFKRIASENITISKDETTASVMMKNNKSCIISFNGDPFQLFYYAMLFFNEWIIKSRQSKIKNVMLDVVSMHILWLCGMIWSRHPLPETTIEAIIRRVVEYVMQFIDENIGKMAAATSKLIWSYCTLELQKIEGIDIRIMTNVLTHSTQLQQYTIDQAVTVANLSN